MTFYCQFFPNLSTASQSMTPGSKAHHQSSGFQILIHILLKFEFSNADINSEKGGSSVNASIFFSVRCGWKNKSNVLYDDSECLE